MGGGEVAVGFEEDVDSVRAGEIAELGESFGDPGQFVLKGRGISGEGIRGEDVSEDADHPCAEIGGEVEVAFAGVELGLAE